VDDNGRFPAKHPPQYAKIGGGKYGAENGHLPQLRYRNRRKHQTAPKRAKKAISGQSKWRGAGPFSFLRLIFANSPNI
jgi:hypothetical protein